MTAEDLLRALESELIPRLLMSHSYASNARQGSRLQAATTQRPQSGDWASAGDIRQFADWCVTENTEAMAKHVADLLAAGIALDSLYLYLIAPTARYLGDRWTNDEVSFIDVQLGMCRLHQLVRDCGGIDFGQPVNTTAHSVLLATAPGDQHTFGTSLVADFFRRYGWRVSNLCGLESEFLLKRISSTWYSAVGFSLHSDASFDVLQNLITEIRLVSRNQELIVLVGGNFFVQNPSLADTVGADFAASDGHKAVMVAQQALDLPVKASLAEQDVGIS